MSCRYKTNKLPGWVTHISYYSIPITVNLNNSLSKRMFVFIHAWQHFIYSNIEIIASASNNCSSFRDFQTAPNFETTSSLSLPESRFLEKRPPASNNAPANGKLPPKITKIMALQLRPNRHHGISNHRRLGCLFNRLSMCRSMKTSKLCVTGFCEGNSPVTGEFPAQRASDAVSIWWRHRENLHVFRRLCESQFKLVSVNNGVHNEYWYNYSERQYMGNITAHALTCLFEEYLRIWWRQDMGIFPHNWHSKSQWYGTLMFYVWLSWTNCWTDSQVTGDFKRHEASVTSL